MTFKTTETPSLDVGNPSPVEFSHFQFSNNLNKALVESGFEKATPIQAATIPLGMQRQDIIGCAQTGTGKTAAFLLPLIHHLERNPHETALILAPTREIVQQISDTARALLKHLPDMRCCSVIGGARMSTQLTQLARKPRVIVGTPGRLNDLLNRRKVDLRNCHTLVFDEADRMLDMGFAPQIDLIVKQVPIQRQTTMFSATMAPGVEKLARTYLKQPKLVHVGQKETVPDGLKQKIIITSQDKREDILNDELNSRKGSILVFVQTQMRVDRLGRRLREYGYNAETIHGGLSQGQRFRALKNFRNGETNILVATDVASRGLDIGNITHVINYDLPTNPEDFLHRVGRTARNGKEGEALTFFLQSDFGDFNRIKKYLKNYETVGEFTKSSMERGGGGSSFRGNKRNFGRFNKFSKKGGHRANGGDRGGRFSTAPQRN